MRLDIRHKALLFIGAAGIGTSLLLGTLLLWGMDMAEQMLHHHTYSIGSSVTAEAENFARDETRKRLEGTLRLQASYLNAILAELEGDVRILADKMTQLMQDPFLPPRRVYDPRVETVASHQPYVLAGDSVEVDWERVQRVAAIEDTMRNLMRNYHAYPLCIYVGSREGWSLRMDFMAEGNAQVTLPPVSMTTAYDVRERIWYREGRLGRPPPPPIRPSTILCAMNPCWPVSWPLKMSRALPEWWA